MTTRGRASLQFRPKVVGALRRRTAGLKQKEVLRGSSTGATNMKTHSVIPHGEQFLAIGGWRTSNIGE
jgi:hypothetical protein